jgi:hypothetical protein
MENRANQRPHVIADDYDEDEESMPSRDDPSSRLCSTRDVYGYHQPRDVMQHHHHINYNLYKRRCDATSTSSHLRPPMSQYHAKQKKMLHEQPPPRPPPRPPATTIAVTAKQQGTATSSDCHVISKDSSHLSSVNSRFIFTLSNDRRQYLV